MGRRPWREEIRLVSVALQPVWGRVAIAAAASVLATIVLAAIITGAWAMRMMASPPQGGSPDAAWVIRQVEKNEVKISEHDKAVAENAKKLAVTERRIRENEQFRESLDALRIGERLATIEQSLGWISIVATGILLTLLGIVGETFHRILTRKKP